MGSRDPSAQPKFPSADVEQMSAGGQEPGLALPVSVYSALLVCSFANRSHSGFC